MHHMIKSIQIKNFKSIVDLSLDLGTFNVLIGENGCGKSNILEGIAFGAAASANKADFEFFGSRGVRVTNPEFMFSGFKKKNKNQKIEISFDIEKGGVNSVKYTLSNRSRNPKKWINKSEIIIDKPLFEEFAEMFFKGATVERAKELANSWGVNEELMIELGNVGKEIQSLVKRWNGELDSKDFIYGIERYFNDKYSDETISNYVIYSPEETSLRRFEDTAQIYPLGIKGEGLFQYLKQISLAKGKKRMLGNIKKNLLLLDWYEGFDLPDNLMANEYALSIKDKYLAPSLQYFDQRSSNEGFLFLLFYSTLFISKDTPTFFGIDNIDASFNPKLCMEITKNLVTLAKKHKKQVILTTQNPAILDGLDLKDDGQRLFVVKRNLEGHTKVKRIEYKAKRKMKLSEVWTSGFIGGLPENF